MAQLTAVILAAGEAKRMRSARPKVLHSLCGRPLIAYPVNAARAVGARIVVVVGRGADEVRAAVDPEAGASFVEQKERLGTGHAVLQAHPLQHLEGPALLLRRRHAEDVRHVAAIHGLKQVVPKL